VVVKSPYDDPSDLLPRLGDSLQVTKERHLVISNFKESASVKQFEPPWKQDILGDRDYTGVTLPVGAKVLVRDVSLGSFPGRPAAVWARVVPE
jgi:hypothetical protein